MYQAVILAAGKSSRFWPLNQRHKALIRIMGKPLIYWTVKGLKESGIKNIIIVQTPEKEIEKELKDNTIKYVVQPKPSGTGDAVWRTKNLIKGPFIVLNAERVDIAEIIENSKLKTKNPKIKAVLIGQKTQHPQLFGIMKIKGDKVLGIIEKPKRNPPSAVRVVGVYFLEPNFFRYCRNDFEKALSLYAKEREVRVCLLQKKEEAVSLKYPWHLFSIIRYLFDKNIGRKEILLGRKVKIFKGAVINGPCYVGDNCIVGNNAVIRDYTNLEEGSVVGALAEVTRSVFQKNAHVHSGFFGDSIFGENCRIGAGTVTANLRFDRKEIKAKIGNKKIKTGLVSLGAIVGDRSRIGINVSLMPGALMGPDSVVWPGSLFPKKLTKQR